MATQRKRKLDSEEDNQSKEFELLPGFSEEENLEFCETVRLQVEQKRMLPLHKFMKAIQALNDLFVYYLRSHGYNSDAHVFSIYSLQHAPYRIELRHYRKTDLVPLLTQDDASSTTSSLQPLLSVVKEEESESSIASRKKEGTEKNLFFRFLFQFLEPKLKDILQKASRKHLSLGSIQLKNLHSFFDLGSIDFYSQTEILVVDNSNGSINKLHYNGMQANAIVDQCAELIGNHPDLTKTLNYQILSFNSPAKRRSTELGSTCGVIHEISPQPIPIVSDNEEINSILQTVYSGDDLQVPYLVVDIQLRLIDNKSVGAYIVHRLHAKGKHNF